MDIRPKTGRFGCEQENKIPVLFLPSSPSGLNSGCFFVLLLGLVLLNVHVDMKRKGGLDSTVHILSFLDYITVNTSVV